MEFMHNGYYFVPFRNFTKAETEQLYLFSKGPLNFFKGFDYTAFYADAEQNDAVTDIYIIDGEYAYPTASGFIRMQPEGVPEHYIRFSEIDLSTEPASGSDSVGDLIESIDKTGAGDFYPTPKAVAHLMLDTNAYLSDDAWRRSWKPLSEMRVNAVLEPSAGRGDLAEAIKERFDGNVQIDCIELNPDLQAVLRGKNIRVVYDDFLTFDTNFMYDVIVMNPPFSNAVSHVRKAMELQSRNGGIVIALINAETIRNPYTQQRKELIRDLTENDARVTFVKNGFQNAARKTAVEIAIIKVKMPAPPIGESDIFSRLTKEEKYNISRKSRPENELIPYDFVEQLVCNYNVEVKSGLELYRIHSELAPYIRPQMAEDGKNETVPMLTLKPSNVNEYIKSVRYKYWRFALNNPEIYGRLTTNIQVAWDMKLKDLVHYDFNERNVKAVFMDMLAQVSNGVEESIMAYFNQFTRYAMYDGSQNVHYYNGWNTNAAYKVNKKIILPCYSVVRDAKTDNFWIQKYGLLDTRRAVSLLQDIEKVFNFLDDGTTRNVDLTHELELASAGHKTRNIATKYFDVSFYKKGTMHITFRNQALVDAFNIYGARKNRWLPETYGTKAYEDMTPDEQSVIDEFQGKESYAAVLANKQFYLQTPENSMRMLTT